MTISPTHLIYNNGVLLGSKTPRITNITEDKQFECDGRDKKHHECILSARLKYIEHRNTDYLYIHLAKWEGDCLEKIGFSNNLLLIWDPRSFGCRERRGCFFSRREYHRQVKTRELRWWFQHSWVDERSWSTHEASKNKNYFRTNARYTWCMALENF